MMLDVEHGPITAGPDNPMAYIFGTSSGHNIIIASLGEPDDGSPPESLATRVITKMEKIFSNIEFGMLICTGGGVPSTPDGSTIQLGDLVVSVPADSHSGGLLHDYVKSRAGHFESIGFVPIPPEDVLIAAEELTRKCNDGEGNPLYEDMIKIYAKHPKHELHRSSSKGQHLSIYSDKFKSHLTVHRGTVSSGRFRIQSAAIRDRLARNYNVLSFEAGAARAVQDLPCIIIQGITNYCDSQAPDQAWHGEAATAAVAFGRQLLVHMNVGEPTRYA